MTRGLEGPAGCWVDVLRRSCCIMIVFTLMDDLLHIVCLMYQLVDASLVFTCNLVSEILHLAYESVKGFQNGCCIFKKNG